MSEISGETTKSTLALPQEPLWERPSRYLAAGFLIVALVGLSLLLKPVFSMVAAGFVFAFLFYKPVSWLATRLKVRYLVGGVIFYIVAIILAILILIVGFTFFQQQIVEFQAAQADISVSEQVPEGSSLASLGGSFDQAAQSFGSALSSLVSNLLNALGIIIAGLFLSFLLLLNLHSAQGSLSAWIPDKYRREFLHISLKMDQVWVGYMVAQVIYGVLIGIGSWVEFTLLGVPFPAVNAILTGIVSLIPTIGGILSDLIVAFSTLLFGSTVFTEMANWQFTLIVMLINGVITQVAYNFVALPIVSKLVKLPISVVFVGVLLGVATGNLFLAFLMVPIISTLTIFGGYILSKILGRQPFPGVELPDKPEVGFFSQLIIPKEKQG